MTKCALHPRVRRTRARSALGGRGLWMVNRANIKGELIRSGLIESPPGARQD